MKSVSIPFYISEDERMEELFTERILNIFLSLKAKRVSLAFKNWLNFDVNIPFVKKAKEYFAQYDIEVAIWLNSLLHLEHKGDYVKRFYANGKEKHTCPLDTSFINDFSEKIAKYAETGVPLIYLDDDFRMNCSDAYNCFCDLHMKEYKKILGEDITREQMIKEVTSGKPSIYRDAWVKVNGDALRNTARKIREKVNAVDPSIRIGICAAPTTMFGVDGVTAFELSDILAGDNLPFMRTIGAPYWAYFGREGYMARLSDVVALERWQAFYAEQIGFKGELIAEGDTYPRLRYATPASYLELFHSAIATENRMDGILKYLGEYTHKNAKETGYSKLAVRRKSKLEAVENAFRGTQKTGFKIFETQDKMKTMEILPEDIISMDYQCTVLHASVRALNDASIPYTYDGDEPIVAIGDNVRYLKDEDFKYGIFTDIVGAKILKEKGIDVGFDSIKSVKETSVCGETYVKYNENEYVKFNRTVELFDLKLNRGAEVLTCVEKADGMSILDENENGETNNPLLYRYEGAQGKIVVCCVDMLQSRFAYGLFGSYRKQRVLADCYQWFKQEDLAAVCFDCPMLMPIVGKKENKLVIGLWNMFEDVLYNQAILLNEEYSKVECIGCAGTLQGKTFILESLSAFDYCAIVLKK